MPSNPPIVSAENGSGLRRQQGPGQSRRARDALRVSSAEAVEVGGVTDGAEASESDGLQERSGMTGRKLEMQMMVS